jgi:hypothetical protein
VMVRLFREDIHYFVARSIREALLVR